MNNQNPIRDDRRIETLLRTALAVEPPEGMRERVLRASRQIAAEKACADHPPFLAGWRRLFAGLAVGLVITGHAVDAVYSAKMAALVSAPHSALPGASVPIILQKRQETERLLALTVGSPASSAFAEVNYGSVHSL